MNLLVEGPPEQVHETLLRVDGVNHVRQMPAQNGRIEFSVETAPGRDSRKELARAVVESGWGLLELRPAGMSLEEIFLKLTTKDEAETIEDMPLPQATPAETPLPEPPEETQG